MDRMAVAELPAETKTARRKRLKAERATVKAKDARKVLREWMARNRYRFPSEARLEAAAMGKPLPAEPCPHCSPRHGGWPVGYERAGVSYECWLDDQSDWFLHNLPSSSSIVRMGDI